MTHKKMFLCLLALLPFFCQAQQTYLDFMNRMAPYYPGCETTEARYDCFVQRVGTILADSINRYHKLHPVNEDKIEAHITLGIKKTGSIAPGATRTNNNALTGVIDTALKALPKVIPPYSPEGEPTATSVSVVLVFKKDNGTGLFNLIYEWNTEKWRATPGPYLKITDAVFAGCDEKGNSLNQCFIEKCAGFIVQKVTFNAKGFAMLRITLDENGKPYSHEVFTPQEELKQQVATALTQLPEIKPSTVEGRPYKATYIVPLVFD
jgi:hypothetical protein